MRQPEAGGALCGAFPREEQSTVDAVNTEVRNPTACGRATVAFVRGPDLRTARNRESAFYTAEPQPPCCHRSSGIGAESWLVGERATRSAVMNRRIAAALVMGTALGPLAVPARAGPCTEKIAQFEKAVRQSAKNTSAGPTAPQSIGAQLGQQPTPSSVKHADEKAQTTFDAALARAKTLDAEGKRKCRQALAHAKRLFSLQ
jgi:hypothetical protein